MERKKWVEIPRGPPSHKSELRQRSISKLMEKKEKLYLTSLGDISRQVHCPPMLIQSNTAGKCIARLCVARIIRPVSTQSSRQVHCPPMCGPHYLLASIYATQPANILPAYALPVNTYRRLFKGAQPASPCPPMEN